MKRSSARFFRVTTGFASGTPHTRNLLGRRHPDVLAKLRLRLAIAVLACACIAASCKPTHPIANGPHCAFADPAVTTSLGICNIVAEYYLAHHKWPQSKAQLEAQWRTMLDSAKQNIPQDEAAELSSFLTRFTLLDFREQDNNLIFRFRFKAGDTGKITDQTVTFKPGLTADEILQSAR